MQRTGAKVNILEDKIVEQSIGSSSIGPRSVALETLPQFPFQNLSGGVLGQLIDDAPMLGTLEARDPIQAKPLQPRQIEHGAGIGDENGHDAFAPFRIGNADHRDLG
jgi:hypothetical protein